MGSTMSIAGWIRVWSRLAPSPPERCAALRTQAEAARITMGLHTLSAVNIAEYAPSLAEAANQYLRAYIDIAKALHAGWIVAGKAPVRKVNAMAYTTPGWTPVEALGLVPACGMTAPRSTAIAKANTTSVRAVW